MNPDAWVSEWWPRVYRMALAISGSETDAEDLAQETLVAALAARDRFRGECAESTWLYAILTRQHRSRMRRRPPESRPALSRPTDVDEALRILATLPDRLRVVAALFYVEELSIREISEALGVHPPTVRWRLFRARRLLRRCGGLVRGRS